MTDAQAITLSVTIIIRTLFITIAAYNVLTDSSYNETKRKELEEETKRLLHGDS